MVELVETPEAPETTPIAKHLEQAQTLGHGAILVTYDPETQNVAATWDPKIFKNFDFIAAIIEMGKQAVEQTAKMAQMQQMMNQQQAQQLASKIKLR